MAASLVGPKVDQLRAAGNGVVALQTALAAKLLAVDLLAYEIAGSAG